MGARACRPHPRAAVRPHDGPGAGGAPLRRALPVVEGERALDAGALGIKLHPRAEGFSLHDPEVEPIFALAHERGVPVLIHAGRGIPALGRDALAHAGRFERAPIILAHAAISDLSWLWAHLPEHPNLCVDTSWWSPPDLLMLLSLAPPGQVLWASDAPYGTPVHNFLVTAMERMMAGEDGDEMLSLARLAATVAPDAPQTEICAAILALLDQHQAYVAELSFGDGEPRFPGIHLLVVAAGLARTPEVPVPPPA